jgi:hypothetical protein
MAASARQHTPRHHICAGAVTVQQGRPQEAALPMTDGSHCPLGGVDVPRPDRWQSE